MLFNSAGFVYFFILVTLAFFILPHKFRWILLLGASCYFYMYFIPIYILILFFTIVIDYYSGIFIEKTQDPGKKKLFLIVSIISNIGILCYFKYYNFFIDNINTLLELGNSGYKLNLLTFILPIGLSFHTFQALSYIIEVYRAKFPAEKHFGTYALYVMFYPQLVAGPIERPQNVLPQLKEVKHFNWDNLIAGLKLIVLGLFKKVVIADRLAVLVNPAFNDPSSHSSPDLILAVYLFTIQIYCDFSGYSDIALGSAKVMGYDLMKNFNKPYFSKSIAEFWSRWHISLSTWFKDYLYIPLGGNRTTKFKWLRNLAIVFLISGIWHGASWNFVIWGGIHAGFLVGGILTAPLLTGITTQLKVFRIPKIIRSAFKVLLTFHLVAFAWIFFRANTFEDAKTIIIKIALWLKTEAYLMAFHTIDYLKSISIINHLASFTLNSIITLLLVVFLFGFEYFSDKTKNSNSYFSNLVYFISFTMLIIILGQSVQEQFIYFQF